MSFFNFVNSNSIVSFSEQRLNPNLMDQIIKSNKMDNPLTSLERALENSDYKTALICIWSERNRPRRLEWLRKPEFQMHAPILFERAMAEFVANPSSYVVNTVSIPLLHAGFIRTMQDMKCSNDPSVYNGDLANRIASVYSTCLNIQIQKKLQTSLEKVTAGENPARDAAIELKKKEIFLQSEADVLPKPDWISWSGMDPFICGKISMKPDQMHKEIRLDYARQELT